MTIEKSDSQPLEKFSWPTTESIRKEKGWVWCTWHWKVKKYVEWFYPSHIWWRSVAFYQRRTRGFDNSDLWDIAYTTSKFVLPRLKDFRKLPFIGTPSMLIPGITENGSCTITTCHEECVCHNKWLSMIDDMIYFHQCIVDDLSEQITTEDKEWWEKHLKEFKDLYVSDQERYKRGEQYWHEYYRSLWD